MNGLLPQRLTSRYPNEYKRGQKFSLMTIVYLYLFIHQSIYAIRLVFLCSIAATMNFTRAKCLVFLDDTVFLGEHLHQLHTTLHSQFVHKSGYSYVELPSYRCVFYHVINIFVSTNNFLLPITIFPVPNLSSAYVEDISLQLHNTYIIGHYNSSARITTYLIALLMLCELILCMSDGTYNLKSITDDRFLRRFSGNFVYSQSFFFQKSGEESRRRIILIYLS